MLIDAAPVSDPRGLVRLRTTLNELTGVRGEASLRPMLRRMTAADYPEAPEAMIDLLATRTHFVDKRGRLQPLFDPALIRLLEPFSLDDVLTAQWPLFDALATAPLLMMRTQMTQQLRRLRLQLDLPTPFLQLPRPAVQPEAGEEQVPRLGSHGRLSPI